MPSNVDRHTHTHESHIDCLPSPTTHTHFPKLSVAQTDTHTDMSYTFIGGVRHTHTQKHLHLDTQINIPRVAGFLPLQSLKCRQCSAPWILTLEPKTWSTAKAVLA